MTMRGILGILCLMLASTDSLHASRPPEDRFVHVLHRENPWRVTRVVADEDELQLSVRDRGLPIEVRVSWDEVLAVDPAVNGVLEAGVERGLRLGDRIRRGVERLRRRDARLAKSAFQEALSLEPVASSAMFAASVEGLVLASIALGETDQVVVDALLLTELAAAGIESGRFDRPGLPGSAIDDETHLVPEVPPVVPSFDAIELESRNRLRRASEVGDDAGIRRDLWMRLLGREGPPGLDERGLDPGTRLLLDLCRLDSDDEQVGAAARRRLLGSISREPAWKVAWIRWFAGSAAIVRAGDDPEAALTGVLDLVHVVAMDDAAPRSLRLASLELAASTLARIGRPDDAAILDAILTYERPVARGAETNQ